MRIFTLIHQSHSADPSAIDSVEIISSCKLPETALASFHFYLDELEKAWREGDEISKDCVFNRFCEATEKYLAIAECNEGKETVWISISELE